MIVPFISLAAGQPADRAFDVQRWACSSSDSSHDDERVNSDAKGKRRNGARFLSLALSLGWQLRNVLPGWSPGICTIRGVFSCTFICLSIISEREHPCSLAWPGQTLRVPSASLPLCSGNPGTRYHVPQSRSLMLSCPAARACRHQTNRGRQIHPDGQRLPRPALPRVSAQPSHLSLVP